MDMHFWVSREELLNPLGLVGREVVGNEVKEAAKRFVVGVCECRI